MDNGPGELMTRRALIGGMAGVASIAVGRCNVFQRDGAYRFRSTVEVATTDGVRRGSSAYRVVAHKGLFRLGDVSGNSSAISDGEAAVIDLPSGPILVLLTLQKAGGRLDGGATIALAPDAARNASN